MTEFERLKSDFDWDIEKIGLMQDGIYFVASENERTLYYPERGNADCASVEEKSFWFNHRNRVIREVMCRMGDCPVMWEIGAGNGYVAAFLGQGGMEVVTVEPGKVGAEQCLRRGLKQSICGYFEDLRLPPLSIPAAGCFDVLEHLEQPAKLLAEIYRALVHKGKLFITVPAMPSLWSEIDEFSGHFCRYTLEKLDNQLTQSGFTRIYASSFMLPLVFPIYWSRVRPSRKGLRRTQSELAELARNQHMAKFAEALRFGCLPFFAIELWLLRIRSLSLGSSIIAAYSKDS